MQFAESVGRVLRARASLVALAFIFWGPSLVAAETVVARRRLGNNVEALTYDPINDRAVAMDGNDVIAIALNPLDAAVLDGTVPVRFADLPLSSPTHGADAQVFDNGSGPRIFTGSEIYDVSGKLLHAVDNAKLGIQNPLLFNGVWLFGNTFATVDGLTSTVIVYTIP
jgi:hypothetical protein